MEILEITKTNDIGHEPYLTLLKKGIRSESLYFVPAIKVVIRPKKWIDCFYRLFWENNYLHLGLGNQSHFIQYPRPEGKELAKEFNAFEMTVTLAEVFDYLYDATPPLYRKVLPDSTKEMDDIIDLLKTFLIEDTAQTQMYQSIFQKITKYGYFEKPNVIDFSYMDAIRQRTPTDLVAQVIHANKPIDSFSDSHEIVFGIFLLGMNNNTDVKLLVDLMFKYQQRTLEVCDITKDPNRGMFLMIKYTGSMLNSIVKKSYAPFLQI
jgi:hypothetical protein